MACADAPEGSDEMTDSQYHCGDLVEIDSGNPLGTGIISNVEYDKFKREFIYTVVFLSGVKRFTENQIKKDSLPTTKKGNKHA